jgi:hypothetical protein
MDSPLQTDFPITIGGKQFTLSFGLEALFIYEDMSGQKVLDDSRTKEEIEAEFNALSNRQKVKRSLDLLYAGLTTHHPELTRKQVGAMVHLNDLSKIDEQVSAAFKATMPGAEKDGEGSGPLVEQSTPS